MTFDRAEYDAYLDEQRKRDDSERRPALSRLAQAAVQAENLTGDPKWDVYMQYLSAGIEAMKERRDGFDRQMKNPLTTNADQIMRAKIGLLEADAMIRAWQAALSLPADIIRDGEKARGVLDRLGDDD